MMISQDGQGVIKVLTGLIKCNKISICSSYIMRQLNILISPLGGQKTQRTLLCRNLPLVGDAAFYFKNYNKMRKIKLISSWDDYCPENIKLAGLLLKYKIPAIFFIECNDKEKIVQAKELAEMGFEIGSHSFSHPNDLKLLSDKELEKEIVHTRMILQKATGQEINWFCYPSGKYDERVKGVVRDAGYKFARTSNLGMPWKDDPYAVYTDFHCYPHRKEYRGARWLDYAINHITKMTEIFKKPPIHFWGHGQEITKYDDWDTLEELFRWLKYNLKY